jgi:4-hydroxybenzoate polyprenyltransferase
MTSVLRAFRALLDGFFLTRPILWIPVWGFAVFGFVSQTRVAQGSLSFTALTLLGVPAWMMLLLFSCSVGAVYVLNQLADTDADRANDGFTLLAHGRVPRGVAWAAAALCAAGSLLVPLLIGTPEASLFSLAALGIGLVYSLPPARFSGRPVLDFVSNAAGYGVVAFGFGWWLAGGACDMRLLQASAPYVLLVCGGSVSSTITDIDGDRAGGKRTTAVVLGPVAAHRLAAAFILISAPVSYVNHDIAALACGLLAIPAYLLHAVCGTRRTLEMTYKVGGAAMMLVAAVHDPALAGAGAGVLAATLMYFRLRFNVRYPSLMPAAHVSQNR